MGELNQPVNSYRQAISEGALTINEVREAEGLSRLLISVEENNRRVQAARRAARQTGVMCPAPECGGELLSDPWRVGIRIAKTKCEKCGGMTDIEVRNPDA